MSIMTIFLDHDEGLLSLPLVPFERSSDGLEPVCALLVCAHRWEWILRGRYFDVVALCGAVRLDEVYPLAGTLLTLELDPASTIE